MSYPMKWFVLTAVVAVLSTTVTHADIVIHDIGNTAANTLVKLGSQFVFGCAILAFGIVAAVFISKRK